MLLADKNNLFRQSLKYYLEREEIAQVLAHSDLAEKVVAELADTEAILICELGNNVSHINQVKDIIQKYRELKIIIIAFALSNDEYYQLINTGVKGCVIKNDDIKELTNAIKEVASGKIFFPNHILQQVMAQRQPNTERTINNLTSRELEILQLLCEGLSNEEISDKLHLSYDTIKWHRSNILIKCGCNNILSLYKYAVNNNLVKVTNVKF